MLGLDKSGIDKLLLQLEERQFIDPRYRFVKDNNELKLLGAGGFSYVYEMFDLLAPENHYAAKVIGLSNKAANEQLISDTTQIQYFLSEQSENIMRVIALWTMKLHLDESGKVTAVIGVNQEGYEESEGVLLEIVLMEKLDNILSKDKYGNTELLRDELKTEEGVIRFAENIGRALFTVHNNGFLHRDVKLENIFWDPKTRQYKLGDFGIARYVGEGEAETVVFTDGYGAPEIERQLLESYNLTADIYSFGITLFLLLNELRFPASDGYRPNIIQYSKDFIVPAPKNSSQEMAGIIRKMCSYHVEDRYQSVEEVLMDIGRIDGSYTDQGFTEYDDLETETYMDIQDSETETYHDFTNEEDQPSDTEEEPSWLNKDDSELTREERKKKIQAENESYTSSSNWRMVYTALLTLLLLKALSPEASYIGRWEFWIVPVALFVESILQRLKEFNAEFGFITIGIAVFSMHCLGIDVPQIAAIFAVLLGMSAITAGFSIGMGLWIAQMLTGRFEWLNIFSRWDLGWLILVFLTYIINCHILFRISYNKATYFESTKNGWIMEKSWALMIIAGIILLVLEHFNVLVIPDILKHIHLIRTGIGIFAAEIFCLWNYGLLDTEEADTDEHLDE
ncbi:protein kinase domain-containing protein [Oribacterium sp. FC2011]|uniref:protein kinase domain-containing protein n=1 Tax=Oribacterium sp. FC2011 TaxID=1408311 RepID=UPI0004E150C9|nr:protein kinase [Oribacterium sp. FC2011]